MARSNASTTMPCIRFYNPDDIDIRGWECPAEFDSVDKFIDYLVETYGEDYALDKKVNFPDKLGYWFSDATDYYYVSKMIEECNVSKDEYPALSSWLNANFRLVPFSKWSETFNMEYNAMKGKSVDAFTIIMAMKKAKDDMMNAPTEERKAVERVLAIIGKVIK